MNPIEKKLTSSVDDVARHSSTGNKRLSLHIRSKGQEILSPNSETTSPIHSPRKWNAPKKEYRTPQSTFSKGDFDIISHQKKLEWDFINVTFPDDVGVLLSRHLAAPTAHVTVLNFINCSIDKVFISHLMNGLIENRSVHTLVFEGCQIEKEAGFYIRQGLEKGCYSLKRLEFVNSFLFKEALEQIVQGLISQNDLVRKIYQVYQVKECISFESLAKNLLDHFRINPNFSLNDFICVLNSPNIESLLDLLESKVGITTLRLEGCRLSGEHLQHLKTLLEGSKKINSLNLIGNTLGAGDIVGKASKSIKALVEALEKNQHLTLLDLTSNLLRQADWKLLEKVIIGTIKEPSKNTTCTVNVSNNSLESCPYYKRLINYGGSPRIRASSQPSNLLANRTKQGITKHHSAESIEEVKKSTLF